MLTSALAILGNAAKDQSVIQILWDMDITEILLTLVNHSVQHVCIPALMLIGLLSLDVNEGSITMDANNILALQNVLADAASSATLTTIVGSFRMTATELLIGINGLAFNRKNAVLLMESGVLPLLIKILSAGNAYDKQSVVELLWTLAFDNNVKKQLSDSLAVQKVLESLSSGEPESGSLSLTLRCAFLKISGWNQIEGR